MNGGGGAASVPSTYGPAAGGRKRRHASSSRCSDTSSGPSSIDVSPRPKKRPLSRVLKALFLDEGAINIHTEMEALKGEKRKARTSAEEKLVYKPKVTVKKASPPPDLRKMDSPGKLTVRVEGKSASAKGKGRAADKIKAKALKVKKQADAKQARKAAAAAVKLKLVKRKEGRKAGAKVVVKGDKKQRDGTTVKTSNQKLGTKALTKLNKRPSPSRDITKKTKVPGIIQAKPKKPVTTEKVHTTNGKQPPSSVSVLQPVKVKANGKKSPSSVSVDHPVKSGAPAEKKKLHKITQDKNLNIIERKTKDVKNGERKESAIAVKSSSPVGSERPSPPSSKSSKSSSPLPLPLESNPVPTSPSSLSYSSLQKRLELATLKQAKRKLVPEDRERASSRSNLGTVRHREICVKKFDRFHQVILCPVTTRLKAGLNVQVMRELRECLTACERDPACRAVLLTSSAGPFCQGLDYTCLLGLSPDKRRRAAEELARELKEFVRAVAGFGKPLVAGVTGACVGLGVALLPLCDLVYVSEKATLQLPYSRLGTVPEGGATHSLTTLLGHMKAGALMMTGRAITGSEALSANLATGLLWSATAYEDLIAQARQVLDNAAQIQALESTKALIRHSLRAKLEMALHSECRLLVHQWCAPEFQQRVRDLYDGGQLLLQKPGFDTQ